MKGHLLRAGLTVMHGGERKYIKTLSFTMGNVIHATLRSEDGTLERVQFLLEDDVEVVQ